MNRTHLRKIFLIAGAITGFGFLFYLCLGDGVAFETQGLWASFANLFGILILFSQFILHFIVLLIICGRGKKGTELTLKQNWIIGIYCLIAVIFNIVLILKTTTFSRAEMSVEREWRNSEKYYWEPAISNPEGYPVRVLEGRFFISSWSRNNAFPDIDDKFYDSRWGLGMTTFISQDQGSMVMPDSLRLTWYSVVEDCYYKLQVSLDKEKITQLFKKGFEAKNHNGVFHRTYDEIIVGLAPGGDVALWVGSNWGNATEVSFYQAQKLDTIVIEPARRQEVREELTRLRKGKDWVEQVHTTDDLIPYDKWRKKYRQPYGWTLQFVKDGVLDNPELEVEFFNGEKFTLIDSTLSQKNFPAQAVPASLFLKCRGEDGKMKREYVVFDEENIYNTFEKLTLSKQEIKVIVTCKINKQGKIEQVTAQNNREEFPLILKKD
ncbi:MULTISPECIES: DUF2931 family protein [Sphingobacterium]|uniref:DUF2931 family protein n=1 Tax=Sphingobacterium TaxID=28453 RepID=UPI0004E5F4E1|nr:MULTISPECIES: DUF2931 family protein [Sphingobacterium]UXD71313.1 DUF2931 family protein [Sphingobacterium faecium]WGQ14960.1 DUF2931 family protein [Sphingobacterium faecium]CDT18248.1 membrane hypothetical protein [Sphingobacterium sp. PM2-P1-29]SJN49284.1 hypothetical protein FM120_23135 [Sphingobacterium faecium PCAi_F2.5]